MWAVTGWALSTWAKLTALLAAGVGVAWLLLGAHSGWFWTVLLAAAGLEVYAIRQLGREWTYEARSSWWWSR